MFTNNKCWIILLGCIQLSRAFNVYIVPAQLDAEVETEFPTEEIPTSTEDLSEFDGITLGKGEYTTYMFQYQNEQYLGIDDTADRCFNDYTKCLTSMISSFRPVCCFHSQQEKVKNIRTFRTTCDMHLDNCFKGYRHWRVVDLGVCIKGPNPLKFTYDMPWLYLEFDVTDT